MIDVNIATLFFCVVAVGLLVVMLVWRVRERRAERERAEIEAQRIADEGGADPLRGGGGGPRPVK